jgi:hypothetical protein
LQVLIGHLMFLHKAIRPARVFVNRILALLRKMGGANRAAIDEDTKGDLQWFTACAHAINGTVSIYKCLQPQIDIFVDASLTGLGGVLSNCVYELSIDHKPDYCIAHWEAINILVAIRTFSSFIWCDNMVAVRRPWRPSVFIMTLGFLLYRFLHYCVLSSFSCVANFQYLRLKIILVLQNHFSKQGGSL